MWNRRDFAVLAAAAVATFGLTLAGFSPRLANAVERAPAATVNVKTPTLKVGGAQVTAARDEADPQTILFTVKNTTAEPTNVEFVAQVMETPSVPSGSRSMPMSQPIWSQEMSRALQGGETQTIKVTLAAYLTDAAAGEAKTAEDSQAAANSGNTNSDQTKAAKSARPKTPPVHYLALADKAQPNQAIMVLNFASAAPAVQVAAATPKVR
jgi:hypothetical protein